MSELFEIRLYVKNDRAPFVDWFEDLDPSAAARVDRYIRRMEQGNFGHSQAVGEGVLELKIDAGPGYRVYYGREGRRVVILVGGGTKRRQSQDIEDAKRRWKDYRQRRTNEPDN